MFKTDTRNRRYRILELDPELLAGLDEDDAEVARAEATAPVATIAEGDWRPAFHGDLDGALGMLILDGLAARTVTVMGKPSTELLVPSDLIRPWQAENLGALPADVGWSVLSPVRVAMLDRRFLVTAGRWPELMVNLTARTMRRARNQGLAAAITRMGRVDTRLLMFFWHLAERVGRVTPEGVLIPVPLTHEVLAALVGARRPSVTTALSGLSRDGLLVRRPGTRHWVLTPAAQTEIERLVRDREAAA